MTAWSIYKWFTVTDREARDIHLSFREIVTTETLLPKKKLNAGHIKEATNDCRSGTDWYFSQINK